MLKICGDYREIKSIFFPGPGEEHMTVGKGIDKIVAYQEPGGMGYATWFAVYHNGVIIQRFNAAHVESVAYV